MALDDTSGVDYAGNGGGRIGHKVADRAGIVVLRAEESISFVIEHAAPDIAVLRVSGELDMLTTPLLESRLRECIEEGCGHLVVDLRGVTFLSVTGLRCLVITTKTATPRGVELHLTGTDHRTVARPLEATGLRPSFNIHPTVDSVVAISDGKPAIRVPSTTVTTSW